MYLFVKLWGNVHYVSGEGKKGGKRGDRPQEKKACVPAKPRQGKARDKAWDEGQARLWSPTNLLCGGLANHHTNPPLLVLCLVLSFSLSSSFSCLCVCVCE